MPPPLTPSIGVTTPPAGFGTFLVLGSLVAPPVFAPDLDAFSADPGNEAGRIAPTGIAPSVAGLVNGTNLFCLGHDHPGFFALCRGGDYVEVSQTDVPPAGNLATVAILLRPPRVAPPAGYHWAMSLWIDGAQVAQQALSLFQADFPRSWSIDLTSGLPGGSARTIAYRLTLVGPALLPIDVEIPAVYVDDVVFTVATAAIVANLSPANGQTTPRMTSFAFDIFAFGRTRTTLDVTINGTTALTGGAFQSGFSGTLTQTGDVLHVVITPVALFDDNSWNTVRVNEAFTDSTTLFATWGFNAYDDAPPQLETVVAMGLKYLRTTWTNQILQSDPAGAHDALNPALYVLTGQSVDADTPCLRGADDPGNLPRIIRAETIYQDIHSSIVMVDLFTDVELTPGATYRLSVSGVEDPWGTSTSSSLTFSYVLPRPAGRVFDLLRLLPRLNRMEDVTHDLVRFVRCFQEPTDLLLSDIDNWPTILDSSFTSEAMVDAMLADLGNPFPFVLTLSKKRLLIPLLKRIYSLAGTPYGILATINFFLREDSAFVVNSDYQIVDYTSDTMRLGVSRLGGSGGAGTWILGPGTSWPFYAFKIQSGIGTPSNDAIAQIAFIAEYMKLAHTHFVLPIKTS